MATTNLTSLKANALTNVVSTILSTSNLIPDSVPKISSITYPGDDTAAATAGGQTITLTGSGFNSGASVLVNGTYAGVVTVVSSTTITFTAPANVGGTYPLYVINTDGGTAISVPGISYSGTPSWSTAAGSIATLYETAAASNTVTATGDTPITYSLYSGTLPPGSSLNTSTGLISGTTEVTASSTTYNFTIRASDTENQDTDRAFSITINPDVVTWNSPADGTSTVLIQNSAMTDVALNATSATGKSISYAADVLPTGVTISGSNVTGTPTVLGSTTSTITATSATTNRSATRTFYWTVNVSGDAYLKNTTLLLNGETFAKPFINDASTSNSHITITGDTKPVTINPYTPGYYSAYFDGTGDYLTVASNAAFTFGTGDFTIEAWIYMTATSSATIFDNRTASTSLHPVFYYTGSNFSLYVAGSGVITGPAAVPNKWYHVAISKVSSSTKMFINGVQVGSTYSDTNNYATSGTVGIGAGLSAGNLTTGYISNLRVVKGTGLYTTTFTPSTTPLTAVSGTSLLACQSNRFIDKSTNAFTITRVGDTTITSTVPFTANSEYSTYGSAYFDGTGDSLSTPNNSGHNFGTGPFTIEFWIKTTDTAFDIVNQTDNGGTNWGMIVTSGNLYWQNSYAAASLYYLNMTTELSSSPINGTWTHIAFTRNASNELRFWINGIVATQIYSSDTTNYAGTGNLRFGAGSYGDFTGNISDFRIVKGTAVYTSNFTPPAAPLTAISGTSILTLQYNGGIINRSFVDDSKFNNLVTRFGNTSQGTFSPYSQTGWSNYFNSPGTTSITTGSNTNNALGSGDYTIEFWCYSTSLGGSNAGSMFYVDMSGYQQLIRHNGSVWECYYKSGTAFSTVSTSTVGINQWVHHALVRSSGTVKWYINGVERGSAADTTNFASSTYFQIGMYGNYYYDGYISNVRVVKGTAVYTSAFTPTTAPLTPISGTLLLTSQSNRFIDNGPINQTFTINGTPTVQAFSPFGSIAEPTPISYGNYFDGTGDYIDVTGIPVPGTGQFTVETWIFTQKVNSSTNQMIYSQYNTSNANRWTININTANKLQVTHPSGNITGATTVPPNQWNHVAVTRDSGNTLRIFLNGVEDATSANYTNTIFQTNARIGYYPNTPLDYFNGYISNLRVLNTALYTGAFTAPTSPLTAVSGTTLLTCQSTRLIDNSTNAYVLTVTGEVKPTRTNPFGYTEQGKTSYTPSIHGGSAYFDGTGDYLTALYNSNFNIPASTPFTLEGWVFTTATTEVHFANRNWSYGGTGPTYAFYLSSGTTPNWSIGGTGSATYVMMSPGTAGRLGQWNHFAWTRDSNNVCRIFTNGIEATGSTRTDSQAMTSTTGNMFIGVSTNLASNYTNGNLSDIRFVVGDCVYKSNFIPPTQTLTDYSTSSPSSLLLNFTEGGIIDQHSTFVLETVGNTQLSSAVKKYGNTSIYFDGTGDYLVSVPVNQLYAFSTGDFTIEAWIYRTDTGVQRAIVDTRDNSSVGTLFYITTNNKLNLFDGTSTFLSSTNTVPANQWVHVAAARASGTTKLFIDGVQEGSVADSRTYAAGSAGLYVGRQYGTTTNDFKGYIDDLRITKGYARYTTNFTPPTEALETK